MKAMMDKRYLELAEENQALRSESSRFNDPVLPDDIQDTKLKTLKQGMLLSNRDNNYTFMYMIHKHSPWKGEEMPESESSEEASVDDVYSWSLFVKIGRQTNALW